MKFTHLSLKENKKMESLERSTFQLVIEKLSNKTSKKLG